MAPGRAGEGERRRPFHLLAFPPLDRLFPVVPSARIEHQQRPRPWRAVEEGGGAVAGPLAGA
jgi:hypothetical protein